MKHINLQFFGGGGASLRGGAAPASNDNGMSMVTNNDGQTFGDIRTLQDKAFSSGYALEESIENSGYSIINSEGSMDTSGRFYAQDDADSDGAVYEISYRNLRSEGVSVTDVRRIEEEDYFG